VKVNLPGWVLDRRTWVMYLIPPGPLKDRFEHLVDIAPDKEFFDVISKHLTALEEGVMPPEAIAPAILNLADDLAAGRNPVLRAGDYISLQHHIRGQLGL